MVRESKGLFTETIKRKTVDEDEKEKMMDNAAEERLCRYAMKLEELKLGILCYRRKKNAV